MSLKTEFTVAHYNLNDLFTPELQDPKQTRPDALAQTILNGVGTVPDFMSACELAYDSPFVPTHTYTTSASNLSVLCERVCKIAKVIPEQFDCSAFAMGNCGTDGRAEELADGDYFYERNTSAQNKLTYGDLVNCLATQPGQYGVGFWSRFPIKDVHIISKLEWKAFNPDADLSPYGIPTRTGTGCGPVPSDITLFDKSFLDVTVDINGTLVHFITTHNMPAFDFGVPTSPNVARNNDQLAFLEWYLTGKTYFEVNATVRDDLGNIMEPLSPDVNFIAMGDLNCDFRLGHPGSDRLISLMNTPAVNVFPKGQTTEISGSLQLQLDYIFSRGVDMVPDSGKIGPMDETKLSDHACLAVKFQTREVKPE